MDEREYRTIDKAAWGEGPWQDEIDKRQWTDSRTGLPCLIVRTASMGNLCGYVGVPRTHPAHGKPYSITSYREELHDPAKPQLCAAINSISAHGGLNYANACQSGGDESEGICHVPAPGEPDDVWWFGFDCAHCFDLMPGLQALCLGLPMIPGSYRTVDYVAAECADLARQLAAIEALTDVAQAFDEAAREAPL